MKKHFMVVEQYGNRPDVPPMITKFKTLSAAERTAKHILESRKEINKNPVTYGCKKIRGAISVYELLKTENI